MMLDADFVAKPSPWRFALIAVGALGFVVAGFWIIGAFGSGPNRGGSWIGWIAIFFFGLCAVVAGKRAMETEDMLRMGASGIWFRPHSDDVIPWSEIKRVSSWEFRGSKSILLELHHPERYPAAGIAAALASANRSMTGADVAITLTGTDRSFEEAMTEIEGYMR